MLQINTGVYLACYGTLTFTLCTDGDAKGKQCCNEQRIFYVIDVFDERKGELRVKSEELRVKS